MPMRNNPAASSDVPTGRRMNGSEMFMPARDSRRVWPRNSGSGCMLAYHGTMVGRARSNGARAPFNPVEIKDKMHWASA